MNETICETEPCATLGIDLGDRYHYFCELDAEGNKAAEGEFAATIEGLEGVFAKRPPARVALKAGMHSPWVSRALEGWGHEVVVANARKLRAMRRETGAREAETLARLALRDAEALAPIHHRSRRTQAHLAVLKSRTMLVEMRAALVSHARRLVKATGKRLPSCDVETFPRNVKDDIPEDLRDAVGPVLQTIDDITDKLKRMSRKIVSLCRTEYPETENLRSVHGVGPLTALTFVLTLEDPMRFSKSRDVPVYLGLLPRGRRAKRNDHDQGGDPYLRRLLVSRGRYILGRLGGDSDLRRWGLALTEPGDPDTKRRAVVAVARKLAVHLHMLWKTGSRYDPFYESQKRAASNATRHSSSRPRTLSAKRERSAPRAMSIQ